MTEDFKKTLKEIIVKRQSGLMPDSELERYIGGDGSESAKKRDK